MYDPQCFERRNQYCKFNRCGKRSSIQVTISDIWISKQRRLPQTVGRDLGLQTATVDVPSAARTGLVALARHHAPRRQTTQHHDRPQAGQSQADRLGPKWILLPIPQFECKSRLKVLQGAGVVSRLLHVRLKSRHLEFRLHAGCYYFQKGTIFPRQFQF